MIFRREFYKMIPIIIIGTLLICIDNIPFVLNYPKVLHDFASQGMISSSSLPWLDFPVYLGEQIIGTVCVRFIGIIVVFLSIGLIAGEIQFGTIKLLLSKPISRPHVYLEKALAGIAGTLLIDILPVLIIFLASMLIGQHLSLGQFISVVISIFAGHFFVLGFSLFQSSLFSDYIKPAIITLILFIVLPSFTNSSSPLRQFYYESYINVTDALRSCQINVLNLGILFILGLFFIWLGLLIFTKRSY